MEVIIPTNRVCVLAISTSFFNFIFILVKLYDIVIHFRMMQVMLEGLSDMNDSNDAWDTSFTSQSANDSIYLPTPQRQCKNSLSSIHVANKVFYDFVSARQVCGTIEQYS